MDVAALRAKYQDLRARLPAEVTVIAVTKSHPPDFIRAAVDAGFEDIGENYAQEALAKFQELGKANARWHFIGQLQTNKVKKLAPFVDVWQSVDNEGLVHEIAKRAPNAKILLQVNMTDDEGRGGCSYEQTPQLLEVARSLDLDVLGLMGVAPLEQDARTAFRRLADTAAQLDLKEVSMGMSADWEVAVEEGATMIRLGSTLFGQRPFAGSEPG